MQPSTTSQYFGMVGGELGVMSKVEPLGRRPVSPELRRVAASSADASAVVADYADHTHEEQLPLSSPPGSSSNLAKDRPGSTNSARKRRGQLFTAAKPPVTRPVEGPEPPAWSESRSGLLSDGGGASVVELALVVAEDGVSTTLVGQRGGCARGSDSSSTTSVTGSGGLRSMEGSEDDSSAFALSFVSAPWAASGDECSEQGPLQTSIHQGSRETGRRKGSKVMPAARKAAALKKARHRGRGRRKTRARGSDSGGGGGSGSQVVALIEKSVSEADAPFREKEGEEGETGGERERDSIQQPTVIDNNSAKATSNRKPQPELYDVWIPQHFFKGKGLPTPKRVSGESDSQAKSPTRLRTTAGAQHESVANVPAASAYGPTASSGSGHPVNRQGGPGETSVAGKRYAVHYVRGPEDFAKNHARMPSIDRTLAEETGSENGVERDHVLLGYGDDGDDQYCITSGMPPRGNSRDDGRLVMSENDDTAILEGDGSIEGWQQEEEEMSRGQSDDEHFDYADRFSWQTAVDVVAEARAEEDARSHNLRSDGGIDDDESLDRRCEARGVMRNVPFEPWNVTPNVLSRLFTWSPFASSLATVLV